MIFIYGDSCGDNIGCKKEMEEGITSFLWDKFSGKCSELKAIKFLPQNSKRFAPQVEGIALKGERKILLKLESYSAYYDGKQDKEYEMEIFNVLCHEMQHIINEVELKDIFYVIENVNDVSYVKLGMNHLIDEYLASYKAHLLVPGAYTGILDCILKIPRDVENKKAEPLKLYLFIIDAIPWFIGETQAIMEISGIDEWKKRIRQIEDERFEMIMQLAKKAIQMFEKGDVDSYINLSQSLSNELLVYVNADIEFLQLLDKYIMKKDAEHKGLTSKLI